MEKVLNSLESALRSWQSLPWPEKNRTWELGMELQGLIEKVKAA